MKQIILALISLTILLSSCATKKSISSSSLENNITTQIDDSININSSSNTITQVDDSTEIIIQETIEETISDSLNGQTTKRTTKRKSTIRKAANAKIEHSEETDTTHNKHIQIQEKKKEENKTKNIKESPFKSFYIYAMICLLILFLIYLYKFKK